MSATNRRASTEPASLRRAPSRKVSLPHKDRVDSILDSARARKIALHGSSDRDSNSDDSPSLPAGMPRTNEVLREGAESSTDEETSIVRRASNQNINYQTTITATKPAKRVRSQPSTSSIRRTGRIYEGARADHTNGGTEQDEHESWWARILSEYGSIELENKGSVARDHLALERTFLAWLRTSLAFASIGIAITQLFRLNTSAVSNNGVDSYKHLRQMGKPLGTTFLGISIVMLGVGFHRYFESQHWIIRGKFPASRGSVALVAAVTFALMLTSLVVVVVVEPGSFEKR